MPSDAEQIRHQLLVLAQRRTCQIIGHPHRWHPTQVMDPDSGQPFTPVGAWEFIVSLLQGGVEIETKILDAPEEGKKAYVIVTPLGARTLYIKLQLGSGHVIGRSFHYSEQE